MAGSRRQFLVTAAVAAAGALLDRGIAYGQDEFTFVQLCDPQLGRGGYEHDVAAFRLAVAQINELHPDFVVICGDLVDETESDEAFADFNRIKAGFRVPCYCVAGNHDVGNYPTIELLDRYRKLVGPDWYAFEHKGHTFVVVNTSVWRSYLTDEIQKQDTWLHDTFKETTKQGSPVIVAGHHPLFAKHAEEQGNYFNLPREKRRELLTLFEEHNVVAVLSGHAHRQIVHDYRVHGKSPDRVIQMVTSASTSRNDDGSPLGFRLWHIGRSRPYRHEYIPLKPK